MALFFTPFEGEAPSVLDTQYWRVNGGIHTQN
jgi:hypothetical protein